jgi:hypothetical protein
MYANHPATCVDRPTILPDRPVLYSSYLAPHADGPNESFRVCAIRGGSGAGLGNLFINIGSVIAGPDGPCSCADGPVVRRSANVPPICVRGCTCLGYVSISIP